MNISYIFFAFFLSICSFNPVLDAASNCNRPQKSNTIDFPVARESVEVIRLITYNIRGESEIDVRQGNEWNLRKYKIAFLISCYQPDLICLQGVSKSYMPDLFFLFSEYTCIAFDINENSKDAVLLIRTERYSVEKPGFFWLLKAPSPIGSLHPPSLDSQSPRATVYTTLTDHLTNKKLIVMCTHFNSRGMESRIKNAENLMLELNKIDPHTPVIIAGDFNFIISTPMTTRKTEEAYAHITSNTLLRDVRDISVENHYGPDGTWIGWEYDKYAAPFGKVGERLDHIFVRHFNVTREGVLNLKVNDSLDALINPSEAEFNNITYPSDHLPAIADIVVQ